MQLIPDRIEEYGNVLMQTLTKIIVKYLKLRHLSHINAYDSSRKRWCIRKQNFSQSANEWGGECNLGGRWFRWNVALSIKRMTPEKQGIHSPL